MATLEWEPLAAALAATLVASGELRDPVWRRAFEEVPRHLFVPRFLDFDENGERGIDSAAPEQHRQWLERVYSDTTLITQLRASGADGHGARRPTSSSSMPRIMAWMLDALDVADGHRVLEIGTGTGYNAALLCHRLGAANVASIDIDPGLVGEARERLAGLGYAPRLATGDGACGVPQAAPYDAIISTAAVDHIPPAWIEQLRPGGVILTDLRGSVAGAMVRLRKIDDDTVEGRCESYDAAFMPMRREVNYPLRDGASVPFVMDRRNPQRGTTTIAPQLITHSRGLRFVVQLQLAQTHPDLFVNADELVLTGTDGSWATASLAPHTDRTHAVAQAGPRRLWDSVEAATEAWQRSGQPEIDTFRVTASTDIADQQVWLGDPPPAFSWPLPI
ncbi:MAG: methyltransferase domain-containing protein [Pseudonocardiaceae bacterium]